jgi:hypothetical protein
MDMKKLVTVFALCAAMSAMAVESQNIVGYKTVAVPKGTTVWTPMFVTTGGDDTQTTLGDIIPSSSFYGDNSGGMLQFLNVTGAGNVTLMAQYWDGYGWYEFGTANELNAMALPKGQSFIVSASANGGATFTFKGQVSVATFSVTVPQGVSIIGNSLPKNLTFADIVPSSSFYGDNSGGMLQFLSATGDGSVTLMAQYWAGYGWYEFGTANELNATALPAGASFIVSASAVGGATFTFPAAF